MPGVVRRRRNLSIGRISAQLAFPRRNNSAHALHTHAHIVIRSEVAFLPPSDLPHLHLSLTCHHHVLHPSICRAEMRAMPPIRPLIVRSSLHTCHGITEETAKEMAKHGSCSSTIESQNHRHCRSNWSTDTSGDSGSRFIA